MNRDMMQGFELFQPVQIKDALTLLDKYEDESWVYAGGKDSLDWFKDRVKKPKAVIDLNGIKDLKGVSILSSENTSLKLKLLFLPLLSFRIS